MRIEGFPEGMELVGYREPVRCEWSAVQCFAEPVMMTASFKFKTQSEMDRAIKVLGTLAGFVCNTATPYEVK